MKRTGLYGVALGCAICVGICAGRVATAGDYVDCSKLETWSRDHSSYDQGKLVYYKPFNSGNEYKCTASRCSSKPGSDSQWTEVAACKGGTDPQ